MPGLSVPTGVPGPDNLTPPTVSTTSVLTMMATSPVVRLDGREAAGCSGVEASTDVGGGGRGGDGGFIGSDISPPMTAGSMLQTCCSTPLCQRAFAGLILNYCLTTGNVGRQKGYSATTATVPIFFVLVFKGSKTSLQVAPQQCTRSTKG